MQITNTFTQEFNSEPSDIVICGSMSHKDEWLQVAGTLRARGFKVETPDISGADGIKKDRGFQMRQHMAKISASKAILAYNATKNGIDNYVGRNTSMEMAVAFAYEKQIYLFNDVPEASYGEEIMSLNPIILHGDISKIAIK